jgi:hypothetical protein
LPRNTVASATDTDISYRRHPERSEGSAVRDFHVDGPIQQWTKSGA